MRYRALFARTLSSARFTSFIGRTSTPEPVTFLWHESHDLENCDAIIVPGGFAYGDYLRTGAHRLEAYGTFCGTPRLEVGSTAVNARLMLTIYCTFAYSALACLRMGISGSAF